MSTVPTKITELLSFCGSHAELWDDAPTTLGLSALQVTNLKAVLGTAETDYNDHQNLIAQAKAKGIKSRASVAALRTNIASLISIIRGFAETQANPAAVYAAAQLPEPTRPSPAPPPGQPFDFKATLNSDGSIKLTWKAPNPSGAAGTVWFIRRKLTGATTYTQIGVVGTRSFIDATIPSSSGGATYVVQGQRANATGDASLPFTIQFGIDGDGLTIVSQGPTALAA